MEAFVTSLGQLQAGFGAHEASRYQARMLSQAARVEQQQAGAREEAQRRMARRVLGSQRAAFGQAGTGTGGSAADVMAQSARDAELDALTIRYEGDLRARGMMAEAEGQRYAGRQARRAGYFQATGTLLGAAGDYAGKGAGA